MGSQPIPTNPWQIKSGRNILSNSADVDASASPATSSPLQLLCGMFPQLNRGTISSVFQRSGQNPSVCADMLLSLQPLTESGPYNAFASSTSTSSPDDNRGSASDLFPNLPFYSVKLIAKYLTLFDLAVFGCINRQCKRLAESELSSVTMLNSVGAMRHASDERILQMLARFPRLTTVSLFKCSSFQSFALLPVALRGAAIRSLNFAYCTAIADDDIRVLLSGFPLLQHLDLTGTDIGDEALEAISLFAVDTLQRLVLSFCKSITDFGITFVHTRCLALKQLDLRSTHIHPAALEASPTGAKLEFLSMSACQRVSRIALAADFASLKTLVLSSNQNMLEAVLILPNLTTLNMSSSKQLNRLILHAQSLSVLNLSGCSGLSNGVFDAHILQRVNLYNCRSLPTTSIASIITGSRSHLMDVNLRGCPQLTDADVIQFVSQCRLIDRFDVTGCKSLSPTALTMVQRLIQAALENRTR